MQRFSGSAVQRFGIAPKIETNNGCNMTGKEPPQLGKTLGLPAKPPAKKRRKPKAKDVKTRKR